MIFDSNNDKNIKNTILIITREAPGSEEKYSVLLEKEYNVSIIHSTDFYPEKLDNQVPDVVIVCHDSNLHTAEIIDKIKQKKSLPTIVLVKKEMLLETNVYLKLSDDFLIWPCDKRELILRINRLLKKAPGVKSCDQIICNDLVIDLTTCEVMVTGTKAELTYKEYELLKLMAGNKGRVFTRQTLLDRIWGFDYFGGDRTVDVHVRRLRSKIENSDRTYIETVRNIGYKFNKEA